MSRTQLSVATFNLYNLNELGIRLYSNSKGWSQDEYDKKIQWTANKLNEVKADVWGFQELWHNQALKDAFSTSSLLKDYTLLVPGNHNGNKILCSGAVKTDILVDEPEWIDNFPETFNLNSQGDDHQTSGISVNIDSFSRPVLHFKIKPHPDSEVIHIYVCHLKSKLPTRIDHEAWYTSHSYSRHSEAIW